MKPFTVSLRALPSRETLYYFFACFASSRETTISLRETTISSRALPSRETLYYFFARNNYFFACFTSSRETLTFSLCLRVKPFTITLREKKFNEVLLIDYLNIENQRPLFIGLNSFITFVRF